MFGDTIPLFARSRSPKLFKVDDVSDTLGTDLPSHLDKEYFESENPWEEIITYF
jgi:hypothetical protein